MPSLLIPDLPEDVYEALASRARAEHRSLAEQAIVELSRLLVPIAREGRLQRVAGLKRRIASEPPRRLPVPPAELIREDRGR